jgi:hypothetical protein
MQEDTLIGFNCQEPSDTKFFNHNQCRKHTDSLVEGKFTILQQRAVRKIDAFECHGFETAEIGYCGRYSHNKMTDQSTFGIPMKFHKDVCNDMVSTKTFSNGFQSFPIQLGATNSFSSFTHGSVVYDGSNIACIGESLRLQNGNLNTNMMKQKHYLITINEIQLMEVKSDIIQPYKQTVLGHSSAGFSYSGHTTFIWQSPQPDCDLLEIMQLSMLSVSPSTWFSDVHKIEISELESYYHTECRVSIIKTTSPGIFLAPNDQVISHIKHIDSYNVDISADYQMRFGYINTKLSKDISTRYRETHPVCAITRFHSPQGTHRISDSSFIRSLGDVSIIFTCKKVIVAPVQDPKCFSLLRVQDINGVIWHLEPNTRILMKNAVNVPCSPSSVPIYLSIQNAFLAYAPDRTVISTNNLTPSNHSVDNSESGLYSKQIIKQWLDLAFVQHLSKHSFSLFQSICKSESCLSLGENPAGIMEHLGRTFSNLDSLNNPISWLGFDLQEIGGKCSIVVCLLVGLYSLYAIAAWCIRLVLFKDASIKICALLCRATFPDFFLIAKSGNQEKV